MKITTRNTHLFTELTVDEITTTVWADSQELEDTILNLLDVAYDLARHTDKSLQDYIKEFLNQ